MICISIANKSRRFALVDLFNAAPQCDLVEVRLDYFDQAPNISEILANKRKPVIMTCRRAKDGGEWMGQEEERLALLRQCIVSRADYVEIELDVADKIRPMPPTKRVITYTNLLEIPDDLPQIYQQALTKKPDVIKLVVPARSPEEVWPVLQILAKPGAPTVVVGVGKPGIMLALLARKVGAPWVYAALERGMEAYFEQVTVDDLAAVYHYSSIARGTPLIAVTGFGEWQYLSVALLNTAFAYLGETVRCLPVEMGSSTLFRKVLEIIKARSAVIDPAHQSAVRDVVAELKPSAALAQAVDFLAHEGGKWLGYNIFCRAVLAALDETLWAGKPKEAREHAENPLKGRVVVFVGANGLAHVLAAGVQRAGGIPIISANDKAASQKLAQALGCRSILVEAVYTTLHDVLVRCENIDLHPGHLKAGMTVADLTGLPRRSNLLTEAEQRGCLVVSPQQLLVQLVSRQVRAITGKSMPEAILFAKLQLLLIED
jgi:3-dehydroquinate dehydratase/shikimate dehydrogenase